MTNKNGGRPKKDGTYRHYKWDELWGRTACDLDAKKVKWSRLTRLVSCPACRQEIRRGDPRSRR